MTDYRQKISPYVFLSKLTLEHDEKQSQNEHQGGRSLSLSQLSHLIHALLHLVIQHPIVLH